MKGIRQDGLHLAAMPGLRGLHSILLPPPVPFWPASPAWGVLGFVMQVQRRGDRTALML